VECEVSVRVHATYFGKFIHVIALHTTPHHTYSEGVNFTSLENVVKHLRALLQTCTTYTAQNI
jgi:hypothetical protein